MERYSFFNAVINEAGGYDREYLAEDFARYFGSFIGNGVYANPANSLMISSRGDMVVQMARGKGWINGYFYENTEAKTFTLDLADGTTARIDRIVLRLDLINRWIIADVKKGVGATNPEPPALQRDSNIYELALADIFVDRNANEITDAEITDRRFDANLCGIVSGIIDQIDATHLFDKYEETFNDWFETAKNSLSGDVAGNLQVQISNNKSNITTLQTTSAKLVNGKVDPAQASSALITISGSITISNTHAGKTLLVNSASAINITLSNMPIGTEIEIVRLGVGAVTILAGNQTIYCTETARTIENQYGAVILKCIATNTWLLAGGVG